MPELLLKAPDPEAFGKIRAIVRTAHKWGGNGREAKFRKIKRVLMTKHPEVIAKAFGGNPNVAAAWIKDNWAAMHGVLYPGKHGFGPTFWRRGGKAKKGTLPASLDNWYGDVEMDGSILDSDTTELFLSATEIEERDGLIWKPVCRTGTWKVNPTGASNPLVIEEKHFNEAITNFKRKAWEFVTLPLSHRDRPEENTGFVADLEVRDDPKKPGVKRLWAGMNITEPDIREKVKRGTIPSQSVGMALNGVLNQETGERVKGAVLKHVCWTPKPFVSGLNYGDLFASIDSVTTSDSIILSYELEDDEDVEFDLADLGLLELEGPAPVWDEKKAWQGIEQQLRDRLDSFAKDWRTEHMPDLPDAESDITASYEDAPVDPGSPTRRLHLWLRGTMEGKALVCASYFGTPDTYWVAEFDVDDSGQVTLDPPDEWTKVEQQWVALAKEMVFFDYGEGQDEAEIEHDDFDIEFESRSVSQDKRDEWQKKGWTLPDGSYPIPSLEEGGKDFLRRAVQSFGRKPTSEVKKHIIKRAKALGLTDMLPDDWKPKKDAKLVRVTRKKQKGGIVLKLRRPFDLLLAKSSWKPERHPRWPEKSPAGKGGEFMRLNQLFDALDKLPSKSMQLNFLTKDATNLNGVEVKKSTHNPEKISVVAKAKNGHSVTYEMDPDGHSMADLVKTLEIVDAKPRPGDSRIRLSKYLKASAGKTNAEIHGSDPNKGADDPKKGPGGQIVPPSKAAKGVKDLSDDELKKRIAAAEDVLKNGTPAERSSTKLQDELKQMRTELADRGSNAPDKEGPFGKGKWRVVYTNKEGKTTSKEWDDQKKAEADYVGLRGNAFITSVGLIDENGDIKSKKGDVTPPRPPKEPAGGKQPAPKTEPVTEKKSDIPKTGEKYKGWKVPKAAVEKDMFDGTFLGYMVNANGLGSIDVESYGWYTSNPMSKAEADEVARRANEITKAIADHTSDTNDAWDALGKKGQGTGALLKGMFGPQKGRAPHVRVIVKQGDNGKLLVTEYDFKSWEVELILPKEPTLQLSKGGVHMEDEVMELTTEELDARIEARAREIAEEQVNTLLADRDSRIEANELALAREREANHRLRVDRRIDSLTKAGFPPAIVKTAKALYLTDSAGDELGQTLELTREVEEDGQKVVKTEEVNLTISKIVDLMLEAYPTTSLDRVEVKLDLSDLSQPPAKGDEGTDEAAAKSADEWYDEMKAEGRIAAGVASD